eukprot:611613-Prorocentrum_minimum.AAC.1
MEPCLPISRGTLALATNTLGPARHQPAPTSSSRCIPTRRFTNLSSLRSLRDFNPNLPSSKVHTAVGGQGRKYRSSADASEPQNPTKSKRIPEASSRGQGGGLERVRRGAPSNDCPEACRVFSWCSREGMYRSSLDARKPQNPINSKEYRWHLQGVLYIV